MKDFIADVKFTAPQLEAACEELEEKFIIAKILSGLKKISAIFILNKIQLLIQKKI